ncbi:ALF repeat-containing protein [Streptomyces sp. PTD5-9]|uniref:ALF repeat-containing protein n=1 Tax=Streptomyces sp. PTD5-9 TaxID=3120150 RepID=UPI003007F94B
MAASGFADRSSAQAVQARAATAAALARKAATAAGQARDEARSAAKHANNAAKAADDAADHAVEAAEAADRSTAHAVAATEAADAATDAVAKAQAVYTLAREVEAEELLGRTNAGIERAKDAKAEYEARQADEARAVERRLAREAEARRLAAAADRPGADTAAIAADGRKLALQAMQSGSPWGRAAAESALGGTDAVVLDYIRNCWSEAAEQDERVRVERLAADSSIKQVRDAADVALKGDAAAIGTFLEVGQYEAGEEAFRVAIAQAISEGGPEVGRTGRAAWRPGPSMPTGRFSPRPST